MCVCELNEMKRCAKTKRKHGGRSNCMAFFADSLEQIFLCFIHFVCSYSMLHFSLLLVGTGLPGWLAAANSHPATAAPQCPRSPGSNVEWDCLIPPSAVLSGSSPRLALCKGLNRAWPGHAAGHAARAVAGESDREAGQARDRRIAHQSSASQIALQWATVGRLVRRCRWTSGAKFLPSSLPVSTSS